MVGTEQLEYKTKCQGPKCVYYIKGFVTDQTQFMYEYLWLGKKRNFYSRWWGSVPTKSDLFPHEMDFLIEVFVFGLFTGAPSSECNLLKSGCPMFSLPTWESSTV